MSSLAASVEGIIRINIFLDSTHLTVVRLLMFVALCAVYAIVLESNFEITYQVVIKMCNSLNSMTILSNSTRRRLSLYVACVHAVVRAASAYLSTRSVSTAGNLQIRRNFEKSKRMIHLWGRRLFPHFIVVSFWVVFDEHFVYQDFLFLSNK